ncbi:MAG: hypothetical protein CRN43_16485, partial [Candidatus Nephrothrix sp. EaCA]
MKKRIFLSWAFALATAGAFAQSQVIKVNALGLIVGQGSVSYERTINAKSAFQINANYGSFSLLGVGYKAYGGGIDYRRYLSGKIEAPRGFYVSGGLSYSNITVSVEGLGSSTSPAGFVKLVAGRQWVHGAFALDIFGGINYNPASDIQINGKAYS